MKTLTILIIMSVITITGFISILNALDRSIFAGCKVVDQVGNTLTIELDDELTTGTDTACEQAERLINKIRANGYSVRLVRDNPNQWVPFTNLISTRP